MAAAEEDERVRRADAAPAASYTASAASAISPASAVSAVSAVSSESDESDELERLKARAKASILPTWVDVPNQADEANNGISLHGGEQDLTVVSYNMLAQGAIRREIFSYCSDSCLKWKYRRALLLRELRLLVGAEGATARPVDVLALQEVDDQFFITFWEPNMKKIGFSGRMLPKGFPDHAKSAHGCAVFFRDSLLEEVDYERVDFRDCASGTEGVEFDELNRMGVGQLLLLKWRKQENAVEPCQSDGQTRCSGVLVANTHLFWNMRYEWVRVKQSHLLASRLLEMLRRHETEQYSVVVCGDHNATPDTFAYTLLTTRTIPEDGDRLWRRLLLPAEHGSADVNDLLKAVAESNDGTLVNKTLRREIETEADRKRVADARALVDDMRKRIPRYSNPYDGYCRITGQPTPEPTLSPAFTSVGKNWSGPLDYTFLLQDIEFDGIKTTRARPIALLRIEDEDVLKIQDGLPNDWRGSDHVPVGISLRF